VHAAEPKARPRRAPAVFGAPRALTPRCPPTHAGVAARGSGGRVPDRRLLSSVDTRSAPSVVPDRSAVPRRRDRGHRQTRRPVVVASPAADTEKGCCLSIIVRSSFPGHSLADGAKGSNLTYVLHRVWESTRAQAANRTMMASLQ
jgi:hypothetical protein